MSKGEGSRQAALGLKRSFPCQLTSESERNRKIKNRIKFILKGPVIQVLENSRTLFLKIKDIW